MRILKNPSVCIRGKNRKTIVTIKEMVTESTGFTGVLIATSFRNVIDLLKYCLTDNDKKNEYTNRVV